MQGIRKVKGGRIAKHKRKNVGGKKIFAPNCGVSVKNNHNNRRAEKHRKRFYENKIFPVLREKIFEQRKKYKRPKKEL